MRIQFSEPKYTTFANPLIKTSFRGIIKPATVGDILEISQKPFLRSGLTKLNKISKEEYYRLLPQEIASLRESLLSKQNPTGETPRMLVRYILENQFMANRIKEAFDKQYGEYNYVVITIGRSLSTVSKLLGIKIGEERVKQIPMSNLSELKDATKNKNNEEFLKVWNLRCNIDDFKNFLDKIGLSKSEIETSGKSYIIMDYTCSGNSLEMAYKILTHEEFLGNKISNIHKSSIQSLINEKNDLVSGIKNSLYNEAYKKFSFVDKHYILDKESLVCATDYNIFKSQPHHKYNYGSPEQVKLFGFGLLDSELGLNSPYSKLDQ